MRNYANQTTNQSAFHSVCITLVPGQGDASDDEQEANEEEEEERAPKKAKKEAKAAGSSDNPNKGKMTCLVRGGEEAPKAKHV